MIVAARTVLRVDCACGGSWQADQLSIGQLTCWCCGLCHNEFHIQRIDKEKYEVTPTGREETPVTVTLQSRTIPTITVRLNAWKYPHSQNDSQEEYSERQRFYYNEHTCPTNWTRQIRQIEFEGDTDPHGVFEFVSVIDGHLED